MLTKKLECKAATAIIFVPLMLFLPLEILQKYNQTCLFPSTSMQSVIAQVNTTQSFNARHNSNNPIFSWTIEQGKTLYDIELRDN